MIKIRAREEGERKKGEDWIEEIIDRRRMVLLERGRKRAKRKKSTEKEQTKSECRNQKRQP